MVDFYPSTNRMTSYNMFPLSSHNTYDEVILRDEFHNFLFGNKYNPPRGVYVTLKRANTKQLCSCINPQTLEKSKGCKNCSKEGYVFYDEIVKTYYSQTATRQFDPQAQEVLADISILNPDVRKYYFEYTIKPTDKDLIVMLKTDDAGNLIRPVIRQHIFNITRVLDLRDINGRVAYYECHTEKEEV